MPDTIIPPPVASAAALARAHEDTHSAHIERSAPPSVRPVMAPPPGFIEAAVERGLAVVTAEEALRPIDPRSIDEIAPHQDVAPAPVNDVVPPSPRRRRDSGIIAGVTAVAAVTAEVAAFADDADDARIAIDDTPTLPFIRIRPPTGGA